jgi:hypothetical protein
MGYNSRSTALSSQYVTGKSLIIDTPWPKGVDNYDLIFKQGLKTETKHRGMERPCGAQLKPEL